MRGTAFSLKCSRCASATLGFAVVTALALSACSHDSAEAPRTPRDERRAATCTVPGVESARPVRVVTLPSACAVGTTGSPAAPQVVRSAEELAAALACEGAEPPAIDLAADDLYLVRYSISPAYAGGETVDDGTTVTFVTRFRSNCPDDPLPMPMQATLAFLLPKGATRAFREASCSLPPDC